MTERSTISETPDTDPRTDGGEEQPETGRVIVYWLPKEGDNGNTRERMTGIQAVETVPGRNEYDQGELVLHQGDGGVCVFDRNNTRGWKAEGAVDATPPLTGDDSNDEGGE